MEISVAKMNAMILMEESVCIRHYSLNSPMEFLFQVRELFIGSWKKLVLLINQKRKPNGITKADKEASKSDDLIKRNFTAEKPLEKCVTDMTEIKASDGKLYISAIFDCYDLAVLGLAMDTNMKAGLCEQTLDNAVKAYPMLCGAILHSDRGTQYTSELYRKAINKYGIRQSMNNAGGSIDRTSLRKKCKVILTISKCITDKIRRNK